MIDILTSLKLKLMKPLRELKLERLENMKRSPLNKLMLMLILVNNPLELKRAYILDLIEK